MGNILIKNGAPPPICSLAKEVAIEENNNEPVIYGFQVRNFATLGTKTQADLPFSSFNARQTYSSFFNICTPFRSLASIIEHICAYVVLLSWKMHSMHIWH